MLIAFAFFLLGSPSAQAQAPADSAQFISQSAPPAEIQSGLPYTVSVTMKNTGTTTWTTGPQPASGQPSGYMLVSMNPTGGNIWNTVPGIQNPNNSVPISATGSQSVPPGQTATFTFVANAPSGGPGAYNFQWQMMHNFVRFFGDVTPNVVCSVLTDNAAFVSQVPPPATMTAGQSYPVSVTMQNTGTSTWQDGTCQILSENPRGNQLLGVSSQPVVGTVTPGGSTTVSFNAVAPSTPGSYNFQWSLSRKNIHEFGQFSTNVPVTVVANSGPAVPSLSLVNAVNNQASLSWTSVLGATSYNVKRSTTNGSGYTTVANVTSSSDIDQGLTNGTTYYYVVTALTSNGESPASNQVAATPTAQAFGFLNVGNGSALSGQVTLFVSMASKAYGSEASPVTFSVDGTVYDSGGDTQESSGNAGANTFFVLDTDALANGPHTLTVQAANGNTASVNVTFSNVLYNISIPNMFDTSGGDGLPTSAAITASLTSAQPWTVSIVTVDSANSVVQSFSGNSASINVSWNGKNAQGTEVDDDAYEVDISYGGSQSCAVSSSAASPNGAAQPIIRRNLLSKNKTGDCFVLFDQAVFPSGYADMIAYLKAIKADLAPSQGNVWNKFSFVIHGTRQPSWTANEIQRIDNHFRSPLTVFYVDSHGGPGFYGGSQFSSGGHFWESTTHTYNNPFGHSIMPTLTQSANYGVANPPALVFIDSCDSAGESQVQPDLSFADDFDIGDGPSGFIGWGGYAVVYGDKPAPRDDWTFWRLDLWSQFTNTNQTYDTAYSHLLRDYGNHGHNWAGPNGYPSDVVVTDWLTGSAF